MTITQPAGKRGNHLGGKIFRRELNRSFIK
jgi:hypothetical protein